MKNSSFYTPEDKNDFMFLYLHKNIDCTSKLNHYAFYTTKQKFIYFRDLFCSVWCVDIIEVRLPKN